MKTSINKFNTFTRKSAPFTEVKRRKDSKLPRMPKLFIPEVVEINGLKIPSTPFGIIKDCPLFIGDLLKVSFPETDSEPGNIEYYSVELTNGQYVLRFKKNDCEMLLADLMKSNKSNIEVLGNIFEKPALRLLLLKN